MGTPKKWENVAWYKLGAKPGEKGSAVFAGHVDSKSGPAVFFNLKDLKKGDLVKNEKGVTLIFQVYDKHAYPRNDAPLQRIFGYTSVQVIRLITCTGNFNYEAHTHKKRLTVSAVLLAEK
ncbi:MAG TPA: class F sortase [Bacillales bacterium]|nr:class F sortase [Bacillales bacterium]